MADIFCHLTIANLLQYKISYGFSEGTVRRRAPPQLGRMPSGMYRPGKRPVCGWRLRCAGSPSLHGHRENPKGIACTASPPPSLYRKPGNLLRGAPQRRPLIRPHGRTEENRQRNDPHTALAGGERAEHIIKLEI